MFFLENFKIIQAKKGIVGMNNVLLLFTSSELGGAERSLTRMAANNISSNLNYKLATLDGSGKWNEWAVQLGLKVISFGVRDKTNIHGKIKLKSLLKTFLYIKKNNITTLYVIGFRASIFTRLFKLFMPNLYVIQGVRWNPNTDSNLDRMFRLFEKYTHCFLNGYITNSQASSDILTKKCNIPQHKVIVKYNGLDNIPNNICDFSDRDLEIITLANLNVRKGYTQFLDVIEKVNKHFPLVKFTFIGRDDLNGEIQKTIVNRMLSNTVNCVGFQSDVKPYLQRAKIFVLPSLWGEGCPTSILEAMSYKLPVIAHSIDGIPELVKHNSDGLLYKVGDTDGMALGIMSLLSDFSLLCKMGISGHAKIESNFLISSCTEKHELALGKLCVVL